MKPLLSIVGISIPCLFLCVSDRLQAQEYVLKDLYVVTPPADYGPVTFPSEGVIALGQTVASALTSFGGTTSHALIWLPPAGEVIDVHPTFFIESALNAT